MRKDVFICHASEDKTAVVNPLVSSFAENGISYWLDDEEIFLGQSITEKVNEGLKKSDFVVVIFSLSFMGKSWPKRELWSVLNREASSGKAIILPIFVGTKNEVNQVIEEYPLLNDKLFYFWDGDANNIANAIINSIRNIRGETAEPQTIMYKCGQCYNHFQQGVHVCLGCKGKVIYGMTPDERAQARQQATMTAITVEIFAFGLIPTFLISYFNVQIPNVGLKSFWIIPIGFLIAVCIGIYFENKIAKKREGEVRTFL